MIFDFRICYWKRLKKQALCIINQSVVRNEVEVARLLETKKPSQNMPKLNTSIKQNKNHPIHPETINTSWYHMVIPYPALVVIAVKTIQLYVLTTKRPRHPYEGAVN